LIESKALPTCGKGVTDQQHLIPPPIIIIIIIIIIEIKDLGGIMSKDCKDTLQTLKTMTKRECDQCQLTVDSWAK